MVNSVGGSSREGDARIQFRCHVDRLYASSGASSPLAPAFTGVGPPQALLRPSLTERIFPLVSQFVDSDTPFPPVSPRQFRRPGISLASRRLGLLRYRLLSVNSGPCPGDEFARARNFRCGCRRYSGISTARASRQYLLRFRGEPDGNVTEYR